MSQDAWHDTMTPQGSLPRPGRMAFRQDCIVVPTLLGRWHVQELDNHVTVDASTPIHRHDAPLAAAVAADLDSGALKGPDREVHNHLLEPGAARQER